MSHDATIGYWLRLGNLISRIEGFDPSNDYFLVRDYQDKSYLLTRDGSSFHPIPDGEAGEILGDASFRKAVTFHDFQDRSQDLSLPDPPANHVMFADQDFVYAARESEETGEPETRVAALWSTS